jgi:hypothetical protein
MNNKAALLSEEFVAEENVNFCKDVSVNGGANADNNTVKTSNLLAPPQEEDFSMTIRQGPLTFNPSPPLEQGEGINLTTANKQDEIMCWHYHLGHLGFPRLKQLTLNGKIPKKLAKVAPPKYPGCPFGAMTKISWCGKETKSSHEVFITTKLGDCISIDQMTSTEIGFYMQLKGKLTKRRYRCATTLSTTLAGCTLSTSNVVSHIIVLWMCVQQTRYVSTGCMC